ncbi:polysaccharide deacetylase family protein [Sphingomonas sp. YL-JM2C]
MDRLTVCLTFDVDGMSSWIGTAKSRNPSMLSRGDFTVVATPRLLDLLRKLDIRGSFAVPGHTAYAFPDMVKRIRDEGHEIVHHGWVHENPADFDEAGERRVLEKGLTALDRAAGVRPTGYRSPAWDFSPATVKLLLEYGFLYDSSCMGHDFEAYYLRTGDDWGPDEPYRFGSTVDLVELPVNWALDDFPAFEFVLGMNPAGIIPEDLGRTWKADFDFALERCPGGIFNLTNHPETIARGSRLAMLERLIDHMRGQAGVVFDTLGSYAAKWKAANPLDQWKAANPLRTGANAIVQAD